MTSSLNSSSRDLREIWVKPDVRLCRPISTDLARANHCSGPAHTGNYSSRHKQRQITLCLSGGYTFGNTKKIRRSLKVQFCHHLSQSCLSVYFWTQKTPKYFSSKRRCHQKSVGSFFCLLAANSHGQTLAACAQHFTKDSFVNKG